MRRRPRRRPGPPRRLADGKSSSAVFPTTPFSVMMPAMSSPGVTSKEGFHTVYAFGGDAGPERVGDLGGRAILDDDVGAALRGGIEVEMGAATKKGTPWCLHETARLWVPILLAVSPLSATRSAPTTTASTLPWDMRLAAAESQMSVPGIFSKAISYAVRRAPWL